MTINPAGCDGQRNSHLCTHSTLCSRLTLQLLRQEVHRVLRTGTLSPIRCHGFGSFGRFCSSVSIHPGGKSCDSPPVPHPSDHACPAISRPPRADTLRFFRRCRPDCSPRSSHTPFGSGGRLLPLPSRSSSLGCSSPRTAVPAQDKECVCQSNLCEPHPRVRANPVFATFPQPNVKGVALNTGLLSGLSRATILQKRISLEHRCACCYGRQSG